MTPADWSSDASGDDRRAVVVATHTSGPSATGPSPVCPLAFYLIFTIGKPAIRVFLTGAVVKGRITWTARGVPLKAVRNLR